MEVELHFKNMGSFQTPAAWMTNMSSSGGSENWLSVSMVSASTILLCNDS